MLIIQSIKYEWAVKAIRSLRSVALAAELDMSSALKWSVNDILLKQDLYICISCSCMIWNGRVFDRSFFTAVHLWNNFLMPLLNRGYIKSCHWSPQRWSGAVVAQPDKNIIAPFFGILLWPEKFSLVINILVYWRRCRLGVLMIKTGSLSTNDCRHSLTRTVLLNAPYT